MEVKQQAQGTRTNAMVSVFKILEALMAAQTEQYGSVSNRLSGRRNTDRIVWPGYEDGVAITPEVKARVIALKHIVDQQLGH